MGQQQQQQVAAMPAQPQQQQEPQILQELPGNWLKCKDAQGIYYFNQVTQQSSDQLPPELAMMAMGAAAGPALAPAPYTQVYQTPGAQPKPSMAQQQMYSQTAGITAIQQQAMQAQNQAQKQALMLAQAQAQAQAAKSQPQNAPRQKLTLGDWAVYEDQQGEFYVNISTG